MVKIDETVFDKILTTAILVVLLVFSFFLLKPILLSIVSGLLLAFIFAPVYDWLNKRIKSKNLTASLMLAFLLIIIFLSIWFLTPILINQSFKIFQAILQIDFVSLLKKIFPSFFVSEQFSTQISSVVSSFLINTGNSITNSLTSILLNLPTISLHILVVLFTFFFVLRDKEEVLEYVKSLLPFPKEIEKKLFEYSSEITKSVMYSHIIIGVLHGIVVGIGFFIFGVPNALFLTFLTAIAGVIPVIGTPLIWIPVAIYMFIAGNNVAAWGVIAFGIIASIIDHILRPLVVAKMTKLHSAVIFISMIGGLFFFGILGLILGPLIVAYLLIILELYKKKPLPGLIIQESSKK